MSDLASKTLAARRYLELCVPVRDLRIYSSMTMVLDVVLGSVLRAGHPTVGASDRFVSDRAAGLNRESVARVIDELYAVGLLVDDTNTPAGDRARADGRAYSGGGPRNRQRVVTLVDVRELDNFLNHPGVEKPGHASELTTGETRPRSMEYPGHRLTGERGNPATGGGETRPTITYGKSLTTFHPSNRDITSYRTITAPDGRTESGSPNTITTQAGRTPSVLSNDSTQELVTIGEALTVMSPETRLWSRSTQASKRQRRRALGPASYVVYSRLLGSDHPLTDTELTKDLNRDRTKHVRDILELQQEVGLATLTPDGWTVGPVRPEDVDPDPLPSVKPSEAPGVPYPNPSTPATVEAVSVDIRGQEQASEDDPDLQEARRMFPAVSDEEALEGLYWQRAQDADAAEDQESGEGILIGSNGKPIAPGGLAALLDT